MIYGHIKDNGIWRAGHKNELYTLYDEPDMDKVVKIRRMEWLGHHCRMQELNPCRMLTVLKPLIAELNPICHLLALSGAHHILHVSRVRVKPYGTRRVGKPKLR